MRLASVLFLALLATAAHAQERIPGTNLVLISYGKVADPWAKEGTMYVRVAFKSKATGNTVIDNLQMNCPTNTVRDDESDWEPIKNFEGFDKLQRAVCDRKWWHF
jgi:hypothetical protein